MVFHEFDLLVFFGNLSRKSKFCESLTRIMGTLHEDLCPFMIISGRIILRMRSRENWNTHFVFNNFFFGYHAVYAIVWKNMVKPDRSQMTVCRVIHNSLTRIVKLVHLDCQKDYNMQGIDGKRKSPRFFFCIPPKCCTYPPFVTWQMSSQ